MLPPQATGSIGFLRPLHHDARLGHGPLDII